jgi:predicted MFS family arabinose efflux permease
MWFFAIVYSVEGIGQAKSGILGQPLTYFLKETQHWDTVRISVTLSVLDIPWIIKPLWGAISDFLPLFGYRRRPYLILASLIGVMAFARLAYIEDPRDLFWVLFLTAVAMAVSSTLCGALLVETGQRHNASARFVNQQWLWFNLAQMVSVLLAGYLLEKINPTDALHAAAWIAAIAPLAVLASVWLIHEPRSAINKTAFQERFAALADALKQRNLWFVACFLFLFYFCPHFGTPLYFEMTDHLHFSQVFIGLLSSISACGWILGGLLYQFLLRSLAPLQLLRFSIAAGVATTLFYLLLSDPVSAVVIWALSGMAAMVAMIATMSLAAEACPRGAEGFAFAGLMSLLNVAQPAGDAFGSVLYESVFGRQFAPLILVAAGSTALLYFLVPMVRSVRSIG